MSIRSWRGALRATSLVLVATFGLASILATGSGSSPGVDAEGNPLPPGAATWFKSFGGPGNDNAARAIPTADGGYAFVGTLKYSPSESELWLVKLDTLGDVEWQRAYGHRELLDEPIWSSLSLNPRQGIDGSIWLIGKGTLEDALLAGDTTAGIVVARLNADGSAAWAHSYSSGGYPGYDFFFPGDEVTETPHSVTPTADGGAVVASWNRANVREVQQGAGVLRDARYVWLLKLSPTGSVQWTRRITDDQFAYAWSSRPEPEEINVRELSNGHLLTNIVAHLKEQPCSDCSPDEFDSTRLVHLRSGGELVVNMRVFADSETDPWGRLEIESRRLSSAAIIDNDRDGEAEAYLLAGSGGHSYGDSRRPHALVVRVDTAGLVDRTHFLTNWGDNSDLRAIAPMCAPVEVGSDPEPCTYVVSGVQGMNAECHLDLLVAEIDQDTDVTRNFPLTSETETGSPVCTWFDPIDLRLVRLARDPRGHVVNVRGHSSPPGIEDSGVLASLSFILIPESLDPLEAQFQLTRFTPLSASVSVTPDGQYLGIEPPQESTGFTYSLERMNEQEDITLSAPLRSPGNRGPSLGSGFALAQTADRGFIVIGESTAMNAAGRAEVWVLRTDATGLIRWQKVIPGLGSNRDSDFGERDGNVVEFLQPSSGGGTQPTSDGFAFSAQLESGLGSVVVKLDTLGDVDWVSPILGTDAQVNLAALPNGELLAVGGAGVGQHAWMARLTQSGSISWSSEIAWTTDPTSESTARRLIRELDFTDVDSWPNGDILVTGFLEDEAAAWRFAPDGQVRWFRVYDLDRLELAGDGLAPAGQIHGAVTVDGGILIGASVATNLGSKNVLVLHADADGRTRWGRVYGAQGAESLGDMDALEDGGVLISGQSLSLGEGAEAWVARLGPDGRIAPGCNAALAEYSLAVDSSVLESETLIRVPQPAVSLLPGTVPSISSRSTDAATYLPSGSEVVVARQCSGVARPDDSGAQPLRYRLTVERGGIEPGPITSFPTGISCGTSLAICSAQFNADASVILRPDSTVSSRLDRWEGCDSSEAGSCVVRMTADRTVRAIFRAGAAAQLTITSIAGDGRVYDQRGLDCRSSLEGTTGSCSNTYPSGEEVMLFVEPGPGQVVLSWGGDCANAPDPTLVHLLMDGPKSCSVVFSGLPPGSPTVQVVLEAIDGATPLADPTAIGRVVSERPGIDCGTDCSEQVPLNSSITLSAEVFPAMAADWEFERFVCPGVPFEQTESRSVTVVVTGDLSCTARFRNTIKRLYVDISNAGGPTPLGSVVSEPAGIDCNIDCDASFPTGQQVVLRARPLSSAVLRTWQGCDTTGPDPNPPGFPVPDVCYVSMNSSRTVAAFFEIGSPGGDGDMTLTVAFTGTGALGGYVSSTPAGINCSTEGGSCSRAYPAGTVVRLIANVYPGSIFDRFIGCSRDNPDSNPATFDCEVDMVDDRFIQIRLFGP